MGAAVVRAYGLEDQTDRRVKRAIDERYRATIVAHWRSATLFPIATFFYAIAVSAIVALGAFFGPEWGLTFGRVSAFIFLSDVFLHVFTDLPEIYADTQTAIAGWRKILTVLDLPIEIVEPEPGVDLPVGPFEVRTTELDYAYREGGPVLRGISVEVNAARTWRSWARQAAGRPRSRSCWPGSPTRRRGTSRWTGWICATCRRHRVGARSAWSRRTGSCSTRASRERAVRQAVGERPGRRDRVRGAGADRLGGVAAARVWTRRSASVGRHCPSASVSSSRWHARRSTSRGC